MEIHQVKTEVSTSEGMDMGMTFSADTSDPMLFSMLFDRLYTHKIRSVCREIISNAYDAMVEAGTLDQPIDIHLPTYTSPSFIVKDRGTGMSPETVTEVFRVCFKSTKRGDNRQIGGYGIGAKSPFSYTSMFTIDSAHGGVSTRYVAYRGEDNIPHLVKSESSPSTETGVTITIPVEAVDIIAFGSEVARLTPYFVDATINLYRDGQFTSTAPHIKYTTKNDNCGVRKDNDGPRIVMANVSFPIEFDQPAFHGVTVFGIPIGQLSSLNIDIFVDNGSIDLTGSRETLAYTNRTLNVLVKKFEGVIHDNVSTLEGIVANAPNWWSALMAINSPIDNIPRNFVLAWLSGNPDWAKKDGKSLIASIAMSETGIPNRQVLVRRVGVIRKGKQVYSTDSARSYNPIKHYPNKVVVVEYNADVSDNTALARVKRWAAEKDDIHAVILSHTGTASAMVDVIPMETIVKETTKPRSPRVQQSDAVRFIHVKWIDLGRMVVHSSLPHKKLVVDDFSSSEVFYTTDSKTTYPLTSKWNITLGDGQQIEVNTSWANINYLFQNSTSRYYAYLVKPSHVKQLSKKPNWHPIAEYGTVIQKHIDELNITRDELAAASLRASVSSSSKLADLCEVLSSFDRTIVQDPDLFQFIDDLNRMYRTHVRSEVKQLARWVTLPAHWIDNIHNTYADMVSRYPLLQHVEINKSSIVDVVNYINTVYTSKQLEKKD